MTTKQSSHLHLDGINRDCFVVLHTQHHLTALLAMTRSGLFQQSQAGGFHDLACYVCHEDTVETTGFCSVSLQRHSPPPVSFVG
jgi:hypothetical protein